MISILRQEATIPFADPGGIQELDIAVLIPCYNEELTIASVIADFQAKLPDATIYVFDNNSTDKTAEIAGQAGAVVYRERRQGKGFVVQSMFRLIQADVYIMIDGDATYPASDVRSPDRPHPTRRGRYGGRVAPARKIEQQIPPDEFVGQSHISLHSECRVSRPFDGHPLRISSIQPRVRQDRRPGRRRIRGGNGTYHKGA